MPWKVRFRDKDFIGNEGWDPEFEFEVREALTDTQELSGSAEIVIHLKDESVDDVTLHESSDPNEFPFDGVRGYYPELGEVFLFSGVPNEGEGQLIALYSAKDFAEPPRFTGDGSWRFRCHEKMSETPEKPAYPSHMEKAPAGLFEHYCMHEGCNSWGSFGFDKRYGLEWYCGEHKGDAEGSEQA